MPRVTITKPTQGDPTKKSLIDALIDNDVFNYTEATGLRAVNLPNGSFEYDTDSDGLPDRWTRTLYTGGTFLLDSTDQNHGKYAAKFTSPGGASNGGGYMVTNEYFEVSPAFSVKILWQMKSTVAGITNKVILQWYDKDKVTLGADTTIYSEAANNDVAWASKSAAGTPPATARWAKLKVIGAENVSPYTAGSVWYDDFRYEFNSSVQKLVLVAAAGAYTTIIPTNVNRLRVKLWGGGGGAGSGNGGGGGAYAEFITAVTPGGTYTGNCGAAGTTGGVAGGNTTFITPASVTLATAGGGLSTSAWTGGTVTWHADIPAAERHGINGGKGGTSVAYGGWSSGVGGVASAVGSEPGGGGHGGFAGAIGRVLIEYLG